MPKKSPNRNTEDLFIDDSKWEDIDDAGFDDDLGTDAGDFR